jgi:NMD protein affecting ribosome stability and mRNA decay
MKTERGNWRPIRRDELRDELVHDAYKAGAKLPSPTRCPDCGAVYRDGRWTWDTAPAGAHETVCPACHRIRDRFPAGYVRVEGPFWRAHRADIEHLVRNREARERAEHPLERVMAVEEEGDSLLITTTDNHLARDIGEALHSAYKGELEYHYNREENLLRVRWRR